MEMKKQPSQKVAWITAVSLGAISVIVQFLEFLGLLIASAVGLAAGLAGLLFTFRAKNLESKKALWITALILSSIGAILGAVGLFYYFAAVR